MGPARAARGPASSTQTDFHRAARAWSFRGLAELRRAPYFGERPSCEPCRKRGEMQWTPNSARNLLDQSVQRSMDVDIVPGRQLNHRQAQLGGAKPGYRRPPVRAPRDIDEQVWMGRVHPEQIVASVVGRP